MRKEEFLKADKEQQLNFLEEKLSGYYLSGEYELVVDLKSFIAKFSKSDFYMEDSNNLKDFTKIVGLIF